MEKSSTGVIQVTDAEKFRDTFQDLFHAGISTDWLAYLSSKERLFHLPGR